MSTPLIFMDLAYGKELGLPHMGGQPVRAI
jgi:hypothetical protein